MQTNLRGTKKEIGHQRGKIPNPRQAAPDPDARSSQTEVQGLPGPRPQERGRGVGGGSRSGGDRGRPALRPAQGRLVARLLRQDRRRLGGSLGEGSQLAVAPSQLQETWNPLWIVPRD